MDKDKNPYALCAKLTGANVSFSAIAHATAGQPEIRRLNRLERVALAYGGKLIRRDGAQLLASFATANAATLAACEMQRRCGGMPSIASNPLALHVGIHRAAIARHQRTKAPAANGRSTERRDLNRRFGFDTAISQASAAPQNSVLISVLVLRTLDRSIQILCRDVPHHAGGTPVYQIDWRAALTLRPPVPIHMVAAPPSRRKLVLRKESQRLVLERLDTVMFFGRDPACEICLSGSHVSRTHAHIEMSPEGCVMTDQSTNGTSVVFQSGHEIWLKNESVILEGRGRFSLGEAMNTKAAEVFEFQVIPG